MFYYQYKYDAENRLRESWTGTQASISAYGFGSTLTDPYRRMDASYQYYLHGPLARLELGDQNHKVQGLDYAYTLQGWLKGVNGSALDANGAGNDIGQDFAVIAKDAYAFSLGYYTGDYKPIGGTGYMAFAHTYQGNSSDITGRSLYNGNISNSTYALSKINNGATTGYSYNYDQLNRLTNLRQHSLSSTGTWGSSSITDKFKEDFRYDGNGNILSLLRHNQNGQAMDQLSYSYNRDTNGKLLNNRLAAVNDAVGVTDSTDMGSSSYSYDAIGNLISDATEGITHIDWSVYGKIKSISKNSGNISYTYDPAGHRVSKTANNVTTYYVRDAQGNSLGVYDIANNAHNWQEQHLYGSSRLGMWRPKLNLDSATGSSIWNTGGLKFFELNNHLGNVMVVISNNRQQVSGGYEADVINEQEYYAFGSAMPGRTYTNPGAVAYRYGFNGKENDNEVKGAGNQQDYGMRIYDPRIGKFLSVDPIEREYPWNGSYNFAENDPIANVDLDGLEKYYAASGVLLGSIGNDTRIRVLNDDYVKTISQNAAKSGVKLSSMFGANSKSNMDQFSIKIIDVPEATQKNIYNTQYSDKVQKLLDKITDSEQGYVDDPSDKGGKTKYGIAENREWKTKNVPKALGIDNDVADIKKLSKTQADYFYYTTRFSAYRINDISNPMLQRAIIDQSVLTPGIVNRNLKKALNSLGYSIQVNSSRLTNSEISILNSADATKVLNGFLNNQTEYYKSLGDKKHEKGWLNRVKTLRPSGSKK